MEFVGLKREKKRKRRRRNFTKKYRNQMKREVKSSKHEKFTMKASDLVKGKKCIVTMEANAFWENYKAADEWRSRHNSTWWKARCFALENENDILKQAIRDLIDNQNAHINVHRKYKCQDQNKYQNMNFNPTDVKNEKNVNDTLEFQLNEDMMDFLTQSVRHKIELQNKKKQIESQNNDIDYRVTGPNAISLVNKRNKNAKLLYGEATSRILAMETALQTTVDKHKDQSKPQYWPNIPLKL